MATYTGIGCMSGSSLDGLDICCVEFTGDEMSDLWGFRIREAETVVYTKEWVKRLTESPSLSGFELMKLNIEYGHFVGECVKSFIDKHELESVQFIASHGHTVFHVPEEGFTFQLGDGEATATHLKVPFVCDFRTKDVSLGGEGAPLVPCGEKYLFRNNDVCINLGGIANIGITGSTGYDICPCNIVLNQLARLKDEHAQYDKDGEMARQGEVIPQLLQQLENLDFYKEPAPKSLWRDYIQQNVFPLLDNSKYKIEDLLRTFTEHVALRVADACISAKLDPQCHHPGHKTNGAIDCSKILITGGGALNRFLLETIETKLGDSEHTLESADELTINFKEALVFAFLGLRCLLGDENVFKGITGSRADTISGSVDDALNRFLLETFESKFGDGEHTLESADELTINFKEALVFAFLGLGCLLGDENVFKEITG